MGDAGEWARVPESGWGGHGSEPQLRQQLGGRDEEGPEQVTRDLTQSQVPR